MSTGAATSVASQQTVSFYVIESPPTISEKEPCLDAQYTEFFFGSHKQGSHAEIVQKK